MEGNIVEFRYRGTRVVADRDGITVRRFWNGTLLLPWELVRDVHASNVLWPPAWRVEIGLIDGSTRTLPVPTAPPHVYDPAFESALEDIHGNWRIHQASAAAAEPQDAAPDAYYASGVRELAYRGGARRNGLLHLAIALFGVIGILFMIAQGRQDFGPQGASGSPGACSAAAAAAGTAGHTYCAVADAKVIEVYRDGRGGVTGLLVGDAAQVGRPMNEPDPLAAEFPRVQPALSDVKVGDSIGFVGVGDWTNDPDDYGLGLATVTWHGKVLAATACVADCATPESERMSDLAGLGASIVWPVFFGLWALWLWLRLRPRPRLRWTLRTLRWLLPTPAAFWVTGVIAFVADGYSAESITPASAIYLAAVMAVVFTIAYGILTVVVTRSRPAAPAPPAGSVL